MFNKLKQFRDLRKKAKTLQSALSQEKVSADRDGIVIEMDGNQEITKLEIPKIFLSPEKKEELEKNLKALMSKCLEKTKSVIAEKLKKMEDFDLSKFSLR